MAVLAPFRGLTYNFSALAPIHLLVAPPYDVISEEEQEEYYRSDPRNVIRLILGRKKVGDSDWDNRYTRSADCFRRWQSEDVLTRADRPSVYVTTLTYDAGDGRGARVRWGLIGVVRIEDEGSGVILPHERTFSAHKDDRLRLMRACNAQFSQIFGLFEDHGERVFQRVKRVLAGPPVVSFEFKDGTRHEMWILQDPPLLAEISRGLRDERIFIADGHHRYETSRNFRNLMRARHGRRSSNRSYEFVMMYLTAMNDPGLTILPSHRLVRRCAGFHVSSFLEKVEKWFEVAPVPLTQSGRSADCRRVQDLLAKKGVSTTAIVFHHHGSPEAYLLSLKPNRREEMGEDLHPCLKELDVLVLSRLILQKTLGFGLEDLNNEDLFHYQSDLHKAVSLVDSGIFQMTFLLNPTRIEQVRDVAGNGLIMPRKSTFFYPKVLSGLVFNRMDPHETLPIL
ncbi:MAG: DUF1015 domain-containing protein [Deltaproteobacteria bacterium]|nr:DUF1015 domain-containing protein [Deltaproteobacteria bacterium]